MTGSPRVSFITLAALALLAPAALAAQNPRTPAPAPRVPVSNPQQDSIKEALDSLTDRLERTEQALERLQHQMEEQAQSKVQTRSRNHLEISGLILINGFYTDTKTNNSDVPTFVAQPVPADTLLPNPAAAAAQVRQTRLGLSLTGSRALGADLSADLQLDFYGGQQPSSGGRTFPLPRIRTAAVRLDWPHVGLLVGQETQIISPLNPVSFASVGIPGFTNAGNLWFWVPQVRLTLETGAHPRFGLQGAALAPMLGSPQTPFLTGADSAERSRRPMVQGRVYIGWGDGETESEIGFGAHRGWISTPADTLITSQAYTADIRLALGEKILLMGEGYWNAQAIAGLGGGAIGQEFGVGGVPVKSRGGWGQLNLRPSFSWEFGGGFGIDDPDDTQLPAATGRDRNIVYEGHVHVRPGGGLIFGVEYRRIATLYSAGTLTANHVNGFMGVAF
ncbi:MAG: hypothetical protein ACHQX4_01210 [Gemmatimonadales bacterium]